MNLVFALIVVLLLCVVVLGMLVALTLALIGGLMTGVPFVAAPRRTFEVLADVCPLDASSVFYDLGCGDGRFVFAMARRYPSARCIGVERAPLPSIFAWVRSRLSPFPNATIRYNDFSNISLGDATHIFVYLFPAVMDRLLPKLQKELRPGVRVVSCDFIFKTRTPTQVIPLGSGPHPHRLYVYDF